MYLMFEHHTRPLIAKSEFAKRIVRALIWGGVSVVISLAIGMIGFHYIDDVPYIDAFQEAAMIFSGMGPTLTMKSAAGKLFAGFYALFSAFALLVPITIVLGPILHRFLHKFHLDEEGASGRMSGK